MADEFDIEDLIYDAVERACVDLIIYKDNSVSGEENDHVVINCLQLHNLDFVNKAPVYINIFIKNYANGMPVRKKIKEVKRAIEKALKGIVKPVGMYFSLEVKFSEMIKDAKEGFYCKTINVEVITEK